MIIDFHTHCFPEKIASRAIAALSSAAGGVTPQHNGTIDSLRETMHENNVDFFVVNNIATNSHQQHSVNDFAASINGGDTVSFGSVFPDAPDWEDELLRIKELGLKGIKFHPDYQGFFVDDEKMKPIYKKVASLGLICVFHAGFDPGYSAPYHNTPDRMVKALSWFDGAPVINAHWGSAGMSDMVLKNLVGLPIYFDTAYGYGTVSKPDILMILEKHGTDKILFGSDCPWHTPEMELRLINSLGLSDDDKDKILFQNAKQLLNI